MNDDAARDVEKESDHDCDVDDVDDDGDSDQYQDDDDFEQTNGYSCPKVECQERKADATFKKYRRHYNTRNFTARSKRGSLADTGVRCRLRSALCWLSDNARSCVYPQETFYAMCRA